MLLVLLGERAGVFAAWPGPKEWQQRRERVRRGGGLNPSQPLVVGNESEVVPVERVPEHHLAEGPGSRAHQVEGLAAVAAQGRARGQRGRDVVHRDGVDIPVKVGRQA